jgi:enediyne biosynthesis protein E4
VFLTAGGVRQREDVFSGGSYGSSSDPRVHFGLGPLTGVDSVEIDWPSGTKQRVTISSVDQILTIVEGKDMAESKPEHSSP